MNPATFKSSLAQDDPPQVGPVLQALWYAAKGDWHQAHRLVQDEESAEAAWVHAHLHRIEGDLGNAGYWYRRAGRPRSNAPIPAEWDEIVATLIGP